MWYEIIHPATPEGTEDSKHVQLHNLCEPTEGLEGNRLHDIELHYLPRLQKLSLAFNQLQVLPELMVWAVKTGSAVEQRLARERR